MVSAAAALAARDIRVLQRSGFGRLTGLVLDDGHYVDIWVDARLADFARSHAVAHQLGHVLLGHTRCVWGRGVAPMGDFNMLRCDQLDDAAEDAADTFATVLLGAPTSEVDHAPAPRVEMSGGVREGVGDVAAPASLEVVADCDAHGDRPAQPRTSRENPFRSALTVTNVV